MSTKYGVQRPQKKTAANEWRFSDLIILLYAVAVGITPEFDFLGIPKVRITDILLPFVLMAGSSKIKKGFPLSGLFIGMFCFDLGSLLVWGKAKLTPGLFYLAKRMVFFLAAFGVSRGISSVKAWNRILRITVFASPLLSLTVLHELNSNLNSGTIMATGEYMRASGIIANQQTSSALYIAVTTCIALSCFSAFRDPFWKVACIASVSIGCAAIFATGSRGGLVSVVLALLVTVIQKPRQGCGLLVMGVLVGLGAWTFTPQTLQERLAGLLPETQVTIGGMSGEVDDTPAFGSSSIYDRWVVASYAMKNLIPDAGMLGLGTGYKKLGSIDNFYLMEWIAHWLVGLIWWLVFQFSILGGCWMQARSSTDPIQKGFATGAVSAMVIMSAAGFQGDSFFLIRPTEALAFILGAVVARRRLES